MNVMKDLLVDATLTLDEGTSLYFEGNLHERIETANYMGNFLRARADRMEAGKLLLD